MIFSIYIRNKKAFSLLELTIVLIILTILLTSAVPSFYRAYLEKAGSKTALEIQNIQDAARSYYLKNGTWPTSIIPVNGQSTDLESNNYLPSTWNALNPFNYPYSLSTNGMGTLLTISTQVSDGAQNIIASKLAMSNVSGTVVTSTIGLPGGSAAPPVFVTTGSVYDGQEIPLPTGYTDSQCQWFISPRNAQVYDSSGKGGCENLESVNTYLSGPNGRTAVANTTGDCRGSWSFYLNYMGICLDS